MHPLIAYPSYQKTLCVNDPKIDTNNTNHAIKNRKNRFSVNFLDKCVVDFVVTLVGDFKDFHHVKEVDDGDLVHDFSARIRHYFQLLKDTFTMLISQYHCLL